MYGYEEATGLGGLLAQAPGGDVYLPGALRLRSPGAMIVGDVTTEGYPPGLPFSIGSTPLGGRPGPQISMGGGDVERNPALQMGSWREVLDWHNSPAPYILLMLLFVYGYVHVSYRRGRVNLGGGMGR